MVDTTLYSFDKNIVKKTMIAKDLTYEKLAHLYGSSKQNLAVIVNRGTARASTILRLEEILETKILHNEIELHWKTRRHFIYLDKKKVLCILVDQDMTRGELAKEISVSPSLLTRWLRGVTSVPLERLERMASVLNVSVEELIE